MSSTEEIVICGQTVSRAGRCIRGPLVILARLSHGGWDDEPKIVAHRWRAVGGESGWWHEAEYRSSRAAIAAFAKLRGHPNAISNRVWIERAFNRAGRQFAAC